MEHTATIVSLTSELAAIVSSLDTTQAIGALNYIRKSLHEVSPMKDEPIDCVVWVPTEMVVANDYNPNIVASPEMELLEHSIASDGYTQPIVTYETESTLEVVDGFHRSQVGKNSPLISDRIHGHLPVTMIKSSRTARSDRISATIRHNRARGVHQVDRMSDIVVELSRRNWSDTRIARELGMEPDEVLRLKQITGLAELFANDKFSMAWEYTSDQ
jgi:ParB-like chromosome segregation protein Spo0J